MLVSLRTRRYREAEHRAALADDAFRAVWDRTLSETSDLAQIKRICREYIEKALAEDDRERLTAPSGRPVYPSGWDGQQEPHHHDRQMIVEGRMVAEETLVDRDHDAVAWKVNDLMARHALPESLRPVLSLGIMQADVEVYDAIEARITGKARDLASAPPAAPVPVGQATSAEPAKPKASELVEPFFVHRAATSKVSHRDRDKERTHLRRFVEVCGDRSVDAYTRGDVTEWLNMLRRLPKNVGKSRKPQTLAEIIESAEKADAPRLSEKAVENNMITLRQFLGFVVDQGHLKRTDREELAADRSFNTVEDDEDAKRDQWASDDLVRFFRSPIWTGCHETVRSRPGSAIVRDAMFWQPLLALYHGNRLEEFSDLYADDIQCRHGVWIVSLNVKRRRLKTAAARRTVPLHPEVIRMGFLDYVRAVAPTPDAPLFPDLELQGKDRRRGPRVTRFFANYRQRLGIYREGVSLHAFRHTANTRLRNAATEYQHERHIERMLGWAQEANSSEGKRTYDHGPDDLRAMAETLALLRYPELDLSHLYVTGAEKRAKEAAAALAGGNGTGAVAAA